MRSNINNERPYQGSQIRENQYNNNYSNTGYRNEPNYTQSPQQRQQQYRQYNQNRQQAKPVYEQAPRKTQTPEDANEQSIGNFCISIVLFLVAFLVFGIVWLIQKYAINHEVSSHYYLKTYQWVSAFPSIFQIKVPWSVSGFILAVVFEWMTWKIPLVIFSYNCIKLRQGAFKWITFIITVLILLAVDSLLHLLLLDIYNSYMYFGFYSLMTVTLALINNGSLDRSKQAFLDCFLPLLYIGIVHSIQVIGLPVLYKIYLNNLDNSSSLFLIVYLFPFFDLLMYALLLFIGKYLSKHVKTFHQQLHFLTLGYAVGTIMLVGYTQVQFYYLTAYYIFRNVFCNYVMYKWDKTLNLPAALPMWIVPYFFSYVLLFLPFCGVGNVITSIGYYSFLLVNTYPVLYVYPNSLYSNSPFTLTNFNLELNTGFTGQIFWLAAPIIWLGLTFSQKYSKKKPQIGFTLIYNIFGIYLFYLGLSSGLATQSLITNSLIS